jgi:hypothetical protein
MKHIALLALITNIAIFTLSAQTPSFYISQYLNKLSPLAEIIARNLGLADKNGNGVIDKAENEGGEGGEGGEGYEQFVAKYGNADIGFFINGITQGANNGKLEENEIVNYYYTRVRFDKNFEKETADTEKEINDYIYANNMPLVWLDDRQDTVMNAVNRILGMEWQYQKVTLDEAEKLFIRTMDRLNIQDLPGEPIATRYGYKQLADFITRKEGYCFEVAQFGFWFFSQFKINSVVVDTVLPAGYGNTRHGVVKLTGNNKIIDYFGSSNEYKISAEQWTILNPLQSISEYYRAQGSMRRAIIGINYLEQAVIYNKYDISTVSHYIEKNADGRAPNHREIIALGEFILDNTNIQSVINSNYLNKAIYESNIGLTLILLLESYSAVRNRRGFDNMTSLLNQHFKDVPGVLQDMNRIKF